MNDENDINKQSPYNKTSADELLSMREKVN